MVVQQNLGIQSSCKLATNRMQETIDEIQRSQAPSQLDIYFEGCLDSALEIQINLTQSFEHAQKWRFYLPFVKAGSVLDRHRPLFCGI